MRSPPRTAPALSAALALFVLHFASSATPLRAQPSPASPAEPLTPVTPVTPATEPPPQAVVVLIAEAGESVELRDVIAELLARQNVEPRFESDARFAPDAWLDQSPSDASTWAFVRVRDAHRAQLYFRGPHGERFLLRELELRDGLDELGRELIARVVESSVVALLRSSEGMSREEARAGLREDEDGDETPKPPPPPPPPPQPAKEPRATPRTQRGVRAQLGQWTGTDLGARAALGLEAGAELRKPHWPRLRARLSAELALPQSIEQDAIEARLLTLPLRLGLDLGTRFGLYLGLSTGLDVSRLDPVSAGDSGLLLADASTELIPSSRAELRYELPLTTAFWLALGILIDVPWQATRYELIEAGTRKSLAKPWAVQPGLALTLGVTP